jgi:hypothetical protein
MQSILHHEGSVQFVLRVSVPCLQWQIGGVVVLPPQQISELQLLPSPGQSEKVH